MTYKIKHGLLQRDSLDESFELIDPNNHFKNKEALVAIDSDTLITLELIINAILNNDFKKWETLDDNKFESIMVLFAKLGYKKEEVIKLLSDIDKG
ncbi:MAG: hypothetical protein ACRCVG_00230 [Methanobacteriaceae archaeon]